MIVQNHAQQSTQVNLIMIDDLINGSLDNALQERDCDLSGNVITSISPDGKYWTKRNEPSPRSELFSLKRFVLSRI